MNAPTFTCATSLRWFGRRLLPAVALVSIAGCGDGLPPTFPVSGQVRFLGGQPVTSGTVEFLSIDGKINSRGSIRDDGSFRLSTFSDGDGAVAGRHRAIVVQFAPGGDALLNHGAHQTRPVVDRRFAQYESSGLEFEVAAKRPNHLQIVVTRSVQ